MGALTRGTAALGLYPDRAGRGSNLFDAEAVDTRGHG